MKGARIHDLYILQEPCPTGNTNAIRERSPSGRETTEAIEQVRASGPLPLSSPTIKAFKYGPPRRRAISSAGTLSRA